MLRLSKKLLFAIEAVVDIAYNAGAEPVQSREITRRQGIPQRYLEQVMQNLVRAGILRGVRGPRGGYLLARERRRITVGEIARTIGGTDLVETALAEANRSELGGRVLAPFWRGLEDEIMTRLDSVSIEDLCLKAHRAGLESEAQARLHYTI